MRCVGPNAPDHLARRPERRRRLGRDGDQLARLAEHPEAAVQEGGHRRVRQVGDVARRAAEGPVRELPSPMGRPSRRPTRGRHEAGHQDDPPGAQPGCGRRPPSRPPPRAGRSPGPPDRARTGSRWHPGPAAWPTKPNTGPQGRQRRLPPGVAAECGGAGGTPRRVGLQAPPAAWRGANSMNSAHWPVRSRMMSSPSVLVVERGPAGRFLRPDRVGLPPPVRDRAQREDMGLRVERHASARCPERTVHRPGGRSSRPCAQGRGAPAARRRSTRPRSVPLPRATARGWACHRGSAHPPGWSRRG